MIEAFRNPFDIFTSFGGFYGAIACKLLGKKSVIFYDDYEYRVNFNLCKFFSSKFVIPALLGIQGRNIIQFSSYKEMAYLFNFAPDIKVLKKFELVKKKYIFYSPHRAYKFGIQGISACRSDGQDC